MKKTLLILSAIGFNSTTCAMEKTQLSSLTHTNQQKNSSQNNLATPLKPNLSNEEIERQIAGIIYKYSDHPQQKKIVAAKVSGTISQPHQHNNPIPENNESSSVEDIKRSKNTPEVSERVNIAMDELTKKYFKQNPKKSSKL